MKIRILDNTIRIRLTRSEVSRLFETGEVEAVTGFVSTPLHYFLRQYEGQQLKADFHDNQIVVLIPMVMAERLHHTDEVGFEEESGPLVILVEKDFVCLDNSLEDQSDNYPNPNMTC